MLIFSIPVDSLLNANKALLQLPLKTHLLGNEHIQYTQYLE